MKNSLLIAGAAGVTLTAAFLFFKDRNPGKEDKTQPALFAPNENPAKAYTINNSKDTTLLFESGSIIKISKETFVDEEGNKISGPVQLNYREFHSVSETILAGIPMVYDSAGIQSHFESAGMFEINAEAAGKPVFINQSKSIEVKMVSLDTNQTKFNQYYLKSPSEKWTYAGKDAYNKLNADELTNTTNTSNLVFDVPALIKPVRTKPGSQQFVIDVSKGAFPELEVFKNILFEVSPKNKNFDAGMTDINWTGVDIERLGETKDYKIMFTAGNKSYEVIAYPAFDTANYDAALEKYNSLISEYKTKTGERLKSEDNKEKQRESQFALYVEALSKFKALAIKYKGIYNDSLAELNRKNMALQATTELVYRTFQVKKFGIWNSDCPQNLPQDVSLACNFVDEEGHEIKPLNIYLVEKNRNVIFTYYPGQKISFNRESENVLIIITSSNTLAWVAADSFKGLTKKDKKHTFSVTQHKKGPVTLNDINTIIS